MKANIRVALVSSFLVLVSCATNCFAGSCSNLGKYFNISREDIASDLKGAKINKLRDLRDDANSCNNEPFEQFKLKDGPNANKDTAKETAQKVLDVLEESSSPIASNSDLSAFNFAVGLGDLFLFSHHDITATTVDNGTLRITGDEKYKLGLWLSTNSFLSESKLCLLYLAGCLAEDKPIRKGLFVAVQMGGSGDSSIVNSFALGFSFAARKQTSLSPGNAPLVFQIGYGWTRIHVLASGYSDGMAMPTGTNQPVLKNTIGNGPVIIVSYAIN